jgi:excinuclease ABC subunit C
MVKDDHHKTRALTDGEAELSIAMEQEVYAFIYNLQEEAHRFAVSHVRNAKRKTMKHSSLEEIPGVGPARAKLLLRAFGTLSALKEASWEEIAAVKGISRPAADAVYAHFRKKKADKK